MANDPKEAIWAFLDRYDELMPDVNRVFGFAAVHGWIWPEDRNWEKEIRALREIVLQ